MFYYSESTEDREKNRSSSRRIQLFSFVRNQEYKVRALGSLEAENLFGEFQDLDPKGVILNNKYTSSWRKLNRYFREN
jgi:hypothetical protein